MAECWVICEASEAMPLTIRVGPDLAAASALYGLEAEALARRFADAPPLGQWFAYDGANEPVGGVTATERVDGRVFVTHRLTAEDAFVPLTETALRSICGPIHVIVSDDQVDRLASVQAFGMESDLTSVTYSVPFATALARLPKRRAAGHFGIARADQVDRDALFTLDTELHGDTPGNDGWEGNRAWFDSELGSAEFDPAGYLVAVDHHGGHLIGLCRMWRNPTGPTLGLLGMRRDRRNGFTAAALLRETLIGSKDWGWLTFETHTARPRLQRRLDRMGAQRTGAYLRYVRS